MSACVVVGDLHLTRFSPEAVGNDLRRLLAEHAGERVVIAGDFFDLAGDAPKEQRKDAIRGILATMPAVRTGIGEHVDRGGELLFCGGNHDNDVGDDATRECLLEELPVAADARERLQTRPWFIREGGLHIEHGHFYDPDNAPAHPLVNGAASLGVHFSAEFIYPTGAHRYLQETDETPLKLFLSAFSRYGKRAPYVVFKYFDSAFKALAQSGPFYQRDDERQLGSDREASYAEAIGVPTSLVDAMMRIGVPSTLESLPATFARLYMDRVAATLALGSGALGFAAGQRGLGGAAATLGTMLMTLSWLNGHNRYSGDVVTHLDRAAHAIRNNTGARLVIFGHTHREAEIDGYANTGSFAFPFRAPGRPYLQIEGERATRRYIRAK